MESSNADALLTCLVVSPTFRTSAMTRASELEIFDTLKFPGHAMCWDALRRLHKVVGPEKPISLFHLKEEMTARFSGAGNDGVLRDILGFLAGTAAIAPSDISEEVARKYLEAAMLKALKLVMSSRLTQAGSHADLLKAMNMTTTELSRSVSDNEAVIEQPLLDPVRFMPAQSKVPTGVRWLDLLSNGGHVRGSLVGMLMPTGGGKTLTATDLVVAQAKRGRHSLLILYEQPLANDVTERLFCRMFDDRDIDFFRDNKPDTWCREDKIRYGQLAKNIGPYVHVVDFASKGNNGCRGVADIEDAVLTLFDAGLELDYVVVDWLWPMVQRYCAANGISAESGGVRNAGTHMIDELGLINKKYNTVGVVLHQLNTTMARANPKHIPVATDAAEIKSFPYMMDACYVVGNRDKETNVMWLCTDKNRRGAPQNILGHMIGARGVIEPATNMAVDFRGRFVDADQPVPDEPEGPYNAASYV